MNIKQEYIRSVKKKSILVHLGIETLSHKFYFSTVEIYCNILLPFRSLRIVNILRMRILLVLNFDHNGMYLSMYVCV